MTELYLTENSSVYEKIEKLLKARIAEPFEILRTKNGKPYIGGDPLFFSLSHSGNVALIAISDKPVGVDLEIISNKSRKVILNSFSNEERAEIESERDFLKHWVVREAYIKMLGSTLAAKLKSLKFTDGVLYDGGQQVDCSCLCADGENFVYSLCVQSNNEKLPEITNL
ncbi:MAG: 4'-phosphopantetheinyl transferase superfamily protein [Clostridia bacterium]|nr:4'-phosphopantetheinyl transferase superfamily protein [Clostridia bacterium]